MTGSREQESATIGESLTWRQTTARWFGFLGPLAAAFMQQQLAYGFTTRACTTGALVLVHLPALLALVVTALAASVSRREYRESETSSAHFFGAAGLVASGLGLALIVAQWLPTLFIHPCQR